MADAKSNVQSATLLENAHKRAAMVTKPDLASSREVRLALMTKYTRPKSASGGRSLPCVKFAVCKLVPSCLTSQTSFLLGSHGPPG